MKYNNFAKEFIQYIVYFSEIFNRSWIAAGVWEKMTPRQNVIADDTLMTWKIHCALMFSPQYCDWNKKQNNR